MADDIKGHVAILTNSKSLRNETEQREISYFDGLVNVIEENRSPGILNFAADHVIFHRMPTSDSVTVAGEMMQKGFVEIFQEMETRMMEKIKFRPGLSHWDRPWGGMPEQFNQYLQTLMDEIEKIHIGVGRYAFRMNKVMPERFDPHTATESFVIRLGLTYTNQRLFYLMAIFFRSRISPRDAWVVQQQTDLLLRWMAPNY